MGIKNAKSQFTRSDTFPPRLQAVTDNRLGNTTTYGYDANSSLETCEYPNGVKHRWGYNTENRLINLKITGIGDVTLKSFAYTLGPAGNRVKVVENSGRTVVWAYDDLYRLKGNRCQTL